jgi:cobalt-zinc-cadmium efflux system membrane fusion protein
MNLKNMTTRISRKHLIAVALIIAFGGVAGGSFCTVGKAPQSESHAHTEEHGDAEHHGAKADKAHAEDARTAIPSTMPRQAARERTVERS